MSQRLLLELWNRSIETQMRLTHLSARSRQLAIAILSSALVVAAFTSFGSAAKAAARCRTP